jgi:small subunit ribosomal protein S20
MPNIRSKKASLIRQRAGRARNVSVRSALKTHAKKAVAAAAQGQPDTGDRLRQAQKLIDKAQKHGVLHKNTAARKKSRLAKAAQRAAGTSKG